MTMKLPVQRKIKIIDANYFSLPGLKGINVFPAFSRYDAENIIKEVCEYFSLTRKQMMKRTRQREIVLARQISIYLIKKYSSLTLVSIAKIFKYDHTTIMHSIRSVMNLIDTKDNASEDMKRIEQGIMFSKT